MRVRLTRCALLVIGIITTVFSGAGRVVAAAPPVPVTSCLAEPRRPPAMSASPISAATRSVGQVRHFPKANLTVSAGTTVDGAIQLEASGGDFGLRKKVQSNGRYTLELEGPRDKVSIGVTENAITVTRGRKTVTLSSETSQAQMDDVRRMLVDSRAIDLLRTAAAEFEASEEDSAASTPLLIADALVGTLTGDVGASRRVARHLSRRARAQLRTVGRPDTCYYQWENTLLWAFMDYEECIFVSYLPGLWCAARWTMQAESAWFNFLVCSGLGI